MGAIDDLVENNRLAAQDRPQARADAAPSRRVAVVACMDARLDVYDTLALRRGEAHVLRNAGGVVTDDVIRSLAISQRRLGTREVMLIHHTGCGMEGLSEDELRAELEQDAGMPAPFAIESFADLDDDVRESIRRVRESPFLPHRDAVRGFVYDVETRLLREVEVASGPRSA